MFVVCCAGSDVCDEVITRSEESLRVCVCVCLIMCDLETSTLRWTRQHLGGFSTNKMQIYIVEYLAEYEFQFAPQ